MNTSTVMHIKEKISGLNQRASEYRSYLVRYQKDLNETLELIRMYESELRALTAHHKPLIEEA